MVAYAKTTSKYFCTYCWHNGHCEVCPRHTPNATCGCYCCRMADRGLQFGWVTWRGYQRMALYFLNVR